MRRVVLLAAGLALIAGLAAAADYLAIGDSITAGSSWPSTCGICPVVFDCTGGCDTTPQSDRDKCGFVRRLDSWLGSGHSVHNGGVGAENTTEALARFAGEMNANCDDPTVCAAVILMHGTNDMNNGVSPETARDNLEDMIDEAKSRDIDVLLMSIVRKVYDLNNTTWQDYRNLVSTLAGTEDLQFVDSHDSLCDVFSCYRENYWIDGDTDDDGIDDLDEGANDCTAPPDEGDDNLGHLDPDGYGVLTDLIQDEFPGSTPAAPNPTSPSGTIMETMPDFVWPDVSTARWYQLDVDGSITWWEGDPACNGGTCTVNPGVVLAEGAHSWRVRGRNLRGMGSWSADEDFEVQTLVPPGEPTPVGPSGSVFESAPKYQWYEVPTATEYDLEVRDSGGNLDAEATALDAGTVCATGLCSFVEGTQLVGPDDYTLKVKARNSAGEGPLSNPGLTFSVLDCADASVMDLEDLEPSPLTTSETIVRCGQITAGAEGPYSIDATGALTVHTRDGFVMYPGFSVSGELTVITP